MKIQRNIYLILGLVLTALTGSTAQQTPVFTEYNYNPFVINAAYAGSQEGAEATLSNAGFGGQLPGSPRNVAFSFNTPLNDGKVGLGVGIINDEIGVTSATQIFAAYSYKIFFDLKQNRPYWQVYNRTVLSFGITAGALLYNEDLLSLGIQGDPNFSENINTTLPTLGASVMFGHGNFFTGISAPSIFGSSLGNQDNLELSTPIYGYIGYHFFNDRFQDFILKPSMLFKYENGAPFQVDANLSVNYKNWFELGAGYRTSNALNFLAGFYLFKNFRALYSFTYASADSALGNTHGIVLNYRGGKGYARN